MQIFPRNRRRFRSLRSTDGFSLIEILIALALLAALTGLVIASFGDVLGRGQEDVAKQFVDNSLETPLISYRIHTGSFPTTEQGLAALVTAPSERGSSWRGPYIKEIPLDPWGNPYQYRYPGTENPTSYDLWSYGPNMAEGGGDDIGNWD